MTPPYQIQQGDALEALTTLRDESVQTIVTSPPYYGLRDYGVDGQLGLEETPAEYLAAIVRVFREARRVLKNDGTLWLNLGDSYAGSGGQGVQAGQQFADRARGKEHITRAARFVGEGLKPKDLMGMPWHVAFALQADGWYLRQDIIWHKPNPMPESVTDRCTKAHEYLFLLSKSERYYFDAEAIKEPRSSTGDRGGIAGWASGPGSHSIIEHNRDRGNARTFRGGQYTNGAKFNNSHATKRTSTGNAPVDTNNRNRRSVWTVATRPYPDAHFATYPPQLIEPCILAGSPVGGTILDPFNGSGTTGEVALTLRRRYVGIEINPDYVELTRRRLDPIAAQEHLFPIEAIA